MAKAGPTMPAASTEPAPAAPVAVDVEATRDRLFEALKPFVAGRPKRSVMFTCALAAQVLDEPEVADLIIKKYNLALLGLKPST